MQHHVTLSTAVCQFFFNLRNNAYGICVDKQRGFRRVINVTKKYKTVIPRFKGSLKCGPSIVILYLQYNPYALGCRFTFFMYFRSSITNNECCLLECDTMQFCSTVSGNVNTSCKTVRCHKTLQ
jgi:hypothetical protein